MSTFKLVLVRHGEQIWTVPNRWTGWHDAELTPTGLEEAKYAGRILKKEGYTFDIIFTSVLKRAIKTVFFIQEELDLHWVDVERHWRLNERAYGSLQGLNRFESVKKYGAETVKMWRRSANYRPTPLEMSDPRWPGHDPKYKYVDKGVLPNAECLNDTVIRVLPYWYDTIVPAMKQGQKPLIVCHGNSMRALIKHLDQVSDEDMVEINIPTSIPLVYELDENLNTVKHYWLASDEMVEKAIKKVKRSHENPEVK